MAADDFLHFPAKAGSANGKKIVLLAGDDEYRSEESMPMLGKILSQRHGFDCTVLLPAGPDGVIKPTDHMLLSNPDALDQADAIVMCLRFRGWKKEVMEKFEAAYLRGVPIIALRTSTHAFDITQSLEQNPWKKWNWNSKDPMWIGGFGKQVLGETWVNHHGNHKVEGCRGIIEEANRGQEILRGKHLSEGGITTRDWMQFSISLLCHDIGYVKGICRDDRDGRFSNGRAGSMAAERRSHRRARAGGLR